ncbi:MAG: hypothetical protein R3Y11_04250 [Pseudomonadota bacterium]
MHSFHDICTSSAMSSQNLQALQNAIESQTSLAILTAYKSSNTPTENQERNAELKQLLHNAGYAYFPIIGAYHCHLPDTQNIEEETLLVLDGHIVGQSNDWNQPARFALLMQAVARRFEQGTMLFRTRTGENLIIQLNGQNDDLGTGFSMPLVLEFYKQRRGPLYGITGIGEKVHARGGALGATMRHKLDNLVHNALDSVLEDFILSTKNAPTI